MEKLGEHARQRQASRGFARSSCPWLSRSILELFSHLLRGRRSYRIAIRRGGLASVELYISQARISVTPQNDCYDDDSRRIQAHQ